MPTLNKLEYLDETKKEIKNALNTNFNSGITDEDTFRSYVGKINNIYTNWTKVTGEGTEITLNNTKKGKMALTPKGNTEQNGTPTPDSPKYIKVVTGKQEIKIQNKNLFNLTQNNTTYNNVTTQYKGSEFILNGTTSTGGNVISVDKNNLPSLGIFPAGTYMVSLITNSGYTANNHSSAFYLRKSDLSVLRSHELDNDDEYSETFTLEEDSELFVQIFSNSNNIVFNDYHMYFLIATDDSTDDYIEHQEQNFEVNLGKQLLDESALTIGTFTYDDSGNRIITNNYVSMEFIAVKPNATYTYSASIPSGYTAIRIVSFTGSKTFINRSDNISFTNKTATFTTSSNTYYIAILMYKTTTDADISEISNKQLEKGTKATSYSPYFTPIELCKIGTYQDYIYKSNGDWYIHKEIEKTVLNGSEDWITNTSNGRTFMLNMTYPNRVGKSNRFNYSNEVSLESKNIFYFGNQQINFVNPKVNNTLINTLEDWKLYLKEQYDNSIPVLVYHILATPTDTLITNTTLIEQLDNLASAMSYDDTTNISSSSENLPIVISVSALMKGGN